MKALVFYITLPFIYAVSLLPFPVLYLLSDFIYLVVYRCAGYRKEVVQTNLRNAFPEKTPEEIEAITREFYHNLCDSMVETVKVLTISKKSIIRRCVLRVESMEHLNKYAAEGRSLIMVMGHMGNWEWAGHPFSLLAPHKLLVIYHPLSNKYFDRLMLYMRSRHGAVLMPMKSAYKDMLAHRSELTNTVFLGDQTPMPGNAYWTRFLHQDTPVFKGTEVIAKKLNYAVVYARIRKLKRGYYEMYMETLTDNPAGTADGEISELHTRRLEQDIIAEPAAWLWSHRRWKHKRPADS